MLDWSKLLNEKRFSELLNRAKNSGASTQRQFRLPQERDHDRILFSTPFRRMGDKTQVFPLESIESIRTRLTHSYEVANLARSLGVELAEFIKEKTPENSDNFARTIPAILAATGLAHDIGNPPFGHQGEFAIRAWFERNKNKLFEKQELTQQHQNDFLYFEGNAQTLRVLTKLQVISDDLGLNLTVGTLAAVMKYVASSDQIDRETHAKKKVGFFTSEQNLVEYIRNEVGLRNNSRHPLTLVMEACDDIAYSVLDAEDSIKKGLISLNDLLAVIEEETNKQSNSNEVLKSLKEKTQLELSDLRKQNLHPNELQDVATQKFRVYAIHAMVSAVAEAFKENYDSIMQGTFDRNLIEVSKASTLCKLLKDFDRDHAFNHKTVLEIELNGYNIINKVMDFLWIGITDREEYDNLESKRRSPFSTYAYSRISQNYRRIFEDKITKHHKNTKLPIRYKEMQLLTDMVSGMTDQFCIDLHDDLNKHYRGM